MPIDLTDAIAVIYGANVHLRTILNKVDLMAIICDANAHLRVINQVDPTDRRSLGLQQFVGDSKHPKILDALARICACANTKYPVLALTMSLRWDSIRIWLAVNAPLRPPDDMAEQVRRLCILLANPDGGVAFREAVVNLCTDKINKRVTKHIVAFDRFIDDFGATGFTDIRDHSDYGKSLKALRLARTTMNTIVKKQLAGDLYYDGLKLISDLIGGMDSDAEERRSDPVQAYGVKFTLAMQGTPHSP